ncbi:MAG: NAD(+) synthase [Firmicutes bacterium]|nr:NAD(+) synthase [Candidatus Fermentithermobacillaceae bacterium]
MEGSLVDAAKKASEIVEWMREAGSRAGTDGAVVGVSGGVDSAVTLMLSCRAWPGKTLGLVLPCHSDPKDVEDALRVIRFAGCEYRVIDLSPAYDLLVASFDAADPSGLDLWDRASLDRQKLARANLKPRLRMLTLYYHANALNRLVVGTGNRSEIYVGYFTKYGDGGVDILPLGDLVKREVKDMARYFGLPEDIVERVPSAGLWPDQTDEGEMGVEYRHLDGYLRGEPVPPEVVRKVEEMHQRSAHKRQMPATPGCGRGG